MVSGERVGHDEVWEMWRGGERVGDEEAMGREKGR